MTVALLGVLVLGPGCAHQTSDEDPSAVPSALAAGVELVTIEAPPDHLRGRVALPAGARVYARPNYVSPSWTLSLPEPPLMSADGPPRVRAFRVIGVVRAGAGSMDGSGDFVAITNDLDGDDRAASQACGPGVTGLGHLRTLLYVPVIHLAEVTTRALEVEPFLPSAGAERLRIGGGVRVGPGTSVVGLPAVEPGTSWRWIDADGIRTLAPIPDDAVGVAWDSEQIATLADDPGEALLRDAEGSTIWLRDDGGASVELTVRNACGEHWRRVDSPAEVATLRALALDVFYDQRPPAEAGPVVELDADYRIPAGTPIRWTDGDLAAEVLSDWSVAIGVGQTWDNRRCFPLPLGDELQRVDAVALACVNPDSLVLLETGASFGVSDELTVGGSIELGPAELIGEGLSENPGENPGAPWDEQTLRAILNGHHESVSECLRPLVLSSKHLESARWNLHMTITDDGRVDAVEVEARGLTRDDVDDCLRAEAFTWLLPQGASGKLLVPVTLGPWTGEHDIGGTEPAAIEPVPESESKAKAKPESERRRGEVIIIRDEDSDEDPGAE